MPNSQQWQSTHYRRRNYAKDGSKALQDHSLNYDFKFPAQEARKPANQFKGDKEKNTESEPGSLWKMLRRYQHNWSCALTCWRRGDCESPWACDEGYWDPNKRYRNWDNQVQVILQSKTLCCSPCVHIPLLKPQTVHIHLSQNNLPRTVRTISKSPPVLSYMHFHLWTTVQIPGLSELLIYPVQKIQGQMWPKLVLSSWAVTVSLSKVFRRIN